LLRVPEKFVRQAESAQMAEITLPEEKLQILDRHPQENRLCLARKPNYPLLLLDEDCWVELVEAKDRTDEPKTTFQAFLDDSTRRVYQAKALKPEAQSQIEDILYFLGNAILLPIEIPKIFFQTLP